MGLTHIKVSIANPARPRRAIELTFLIDSGAVYSVVPATLLRKLRVKPHSKRTFILADGSEIPRKMGDVLFRLDGRQGAARPDETPTASLTHGPWLARIPSNARPSGIAPLL